MSLSIAFIIFLLMMEQNPFPFASLNDFDLTNLLDCNTVIHKFPLSVINTMIYRPFIYFQNDIHVSGNLSFQHNVCEPCCDYVYNELVTHSNSQCLNLLAFNISSIPFHLDSCIDQCVNVSGIRCGVLALCETRLNDDICWHDLPST